MINDASPEGLPGRTGINGRETSTLILAFDASCRTCSSIAARTAEICGSQFRVLSLTHPEVMELRQVALGPDAPWAPTLLDPHSTPPRAWTGRKLAVRLAWLIGPRKSWRVLKAVGAVRAEGRLGPRDAAPRISRARFLGGIPLVVGGATLLLSSPSAAAPGRSLRPTATPSNAVLANQLTGKGLFDSAISTLDSPDLQNVLDQELIGRLRTSARVDEPQYQNDLGLIRYADAGTTEVAPGSTVAGSCALVRSAEHRVGTNTVVVTAYVLPEERRAVTHERYEKEFDGVLSRARVWRIPDSPDGEFSLDGYSVNGAAPTPTSGTALAAFSTNSANPCGACDLDPWSANQTLGEECSGGAFYECAKTAAPCAGCAVVCSAGGLACIGCLMSTCPFAYFDCCGGRVRACISCPRGD